MPPTITADRNSSSIASAEHMMEKRPRGGIYEFRPGLTALDFHRAVAERASCDTTCVALAVAATSLATIQEHEVQPGAIPEPGLLQVGLFSNRSSRRPIVSRNRCGVHNCILLERGSVKRHSSSGETDPEVANVRPLRWVSLVRPVVKKAALALAGHDLIGGFGRMKNCRVRAGGKDGIPGLATQLIAEDRHALRRLEAKTHLVTPDGNDGHPDVVANDNLFVDFTAQDQHGETSLCTKVPANSHIRPVDGKSIDPIRSEMTTCGHTSHVKREQGVAEIPGSFLETCQCMQCLSTQRTTKVRPYPLANSGLAMISTPQAEKSPAQANVA